MSTFKIEDVSTLAALARQFPESTVAQRMLLRAAVTAKDAALARSALHKLEGMGHALRGENLDQMVALVGQSEVAAAKARSAQLAAPAARSEFSRPSIRATGWSRVWRSTGATLVTIFRQSSAGNCW